MKLSKSLAVITLVICFSATSAFALPEVSNQINSDTDQGISDNLKKEKKVFKGKKHEWDKKRFEEFQKDPIKALENRKKEIENMQKEGKITKEKADAIQEKIDSKIKEIKEFNKLSLKDKKEKLKSNLKNRLEQKVKDGKITQEKASEIITRFSEKVENWDGNGYPGFFDKGFRKNK